MLDALLTGSDECDVIDRLFKTELIELDRLCRTLAQLELATGRGRLVQPPPTVRPPRLSPPAKAETTFYRDKPVVPDPA